MRGQKYALLDFLCIDSGLRFLPRSNELEPICKWETNNIWLIF